MRVRPLLVAAAFGIGLCNISTIATEQEPVIPGKADLIRFLEVHRPHGAVWVEANEVEGIGSLRVALTVTCDTDSAAIVRAFSDSVYPVWFVPASLDRAVRIGEWASLSEHAGGALGLVKQVYVVIGQPTADAAIERAKGLR